MPVVESPLMDSQWKGRIMLKQNALSWMVSGRVNHIEAERAIMDGQWKGKS